MKKTVWVLHCWADDMAEVETIGWYPTLDTAVSWAAAYLEGERGVGIAGRHRGVFSVCQDDRPR